MNQTNLLAMLIQDHEYIKDQFTEAKQAGEDRAAFHELVEFLVRHEVAEEAIVYPAVRKLPAGEAIADARINEQALAEEELDELEEAGPDEFASLLLSLEQDVLDHATQEEKTAFKLLAESLPENELMELGEKYQKAKEAAPTHPHPAAPNTPPGNIFMGPVASFVDRVRDAVYRK